MFIVADNLSRDLSGYPPSKTPFNLLNCCYVLNGISDLKAFLGFRFFSPSKDAVSMKAAPSAEEVNKIRSAGNIYYALVRTISPTNTLLQLTYSNFPFLITFVIVP